MRQALNRIAAKDRKEDKKNREWTRMQDANEREEKQEPQPRNSPGSHGRRWTQIWFWGSITVLVGEN